MTTLGSKELIELSFCIFMAIIYALMCYNISTSKREAFKMCITYDNMQFFNWDEDKEIANEKKHGISFREAASVFKDPNILIKPDVDHSKDEDRFIIIGLSDKPRLLVVCHCYRESDTIIRIISARKATVNESIAYGGGL